MTVVREGRNGILGLGAEEALVRVTLKTSEPALTSDITGAAKEVLEKLLSLMGIKGTVEPQAQPANDGEEKSESVSFEIKGDDLGILIGRRGQTVASLQYIVRLIVGHRTDARAPILIDVEGYKKRRYQTLEVFARQMANQVQVRKTSFTFEPMSAYERRIIHITLADHPAVITQSVGQGESRRVVIIPKE